MQFNLWFRFVCRKLTLMVFDLFVGVNVIMMITVVGRFSIRVRFNIMLYSYEERSVGVFLKFG